jgi:hypothetical protein
VKVEPKWRQSRSLLAEFGYRTEEWRERGIMNYQLWIGEREEGIMNYEVGRKNKNNLLTSEDRLLKTDFW